MGDDGDRVRRPYGDRLLLTEAEAGLPEGLWRVVPEWDQPRNWCDVVGCFEPDYRDILDGTSTELRPMYLDVKGEYLICRRCLLK